jgi:hypothetical protein
MSAPGRFGSLTQGPMLCVVGLLLSLSGCAGGSLPGSGDSTHTDSGKAGAGWQSSALLNGPTVRPLKKKGWVEVEAAVLAADDESPAAARRRAITRARQAAVEFVAGVSVRSSVVLLDQVTERATSDFLQSLTASHADALVVDEKLVDSRIVMTDQGGYEVRIRLAARVLNHKQGGAAGFETEVRLNRANYQAGDRVELAVRVSEAARVYVLSVSESGAVVLLPNRHMPDTRVSADEWLEFPGDDLAGRGVALEARVAAGSLQSREALIVVALRGRRRLETELPASGDTFSSAEGSEAMILASDFLSPLLSIPPSEWTFDQVVYSISAH